MRGNHTTWINYNTQLIKTGKNLESRNLSLKKWQKQITRKMRASHTVWDKLQGIIDENRQNTGNNNSCWKFRTAIRKAVKWHKQVEFRIPFSDCQISFNIFAWLLSFWAIVTELHRVYTKNKNITLLLVHLFPCIFKKFEGVVVWGWLRSFL